MQKTTHDLAVRTKNFARQAVRFFPKLPRTTEAQVLGKQLLRAATSVGANYREAYRGRSKAEFIAKCGDSLAPPALAPATLAALPSTRTAPARACS